MLQTVYSNNSVLKTSFICTSLLEDIWFNISSKLIVRYGGDKKYSVPAML